MTTNSKICIASDSLLIGEALCRQLEAGHQSGINLFFYEKELLNFVEANKTALVVLFSRLKDVTTHDILNKIKQISRQSRVILIDNNIARLKYILSTQGDVCKGILFHDIGAGELLHCLSEVTNARGYISSQVKFFHQVDDLTGIVNAVNQLSPREKEIFQLIGEGCTSTQVADRLYISTTTVNNHKTNLCNKLGLARKDLYSAAVKYKEYLIKIFN